MDDKKEPLVIAVSSTALFDLTEVNDKFQKAKKRDYTQAVKEYWSYVKEHEDEPLQGGTGMPLVKALLELNEKHAKPDEPLIEVVVMSRNTPDTGYRVVKQTREHELKVDRFAFCGGEPVAPYLSAFRVDLFLTTNKEDAQSAYEEKACAAALLQPPPSSPVKEDSKVVCIAFDGDEVIFGEESEETYREKGLQEFAKSEDELRDKPLTKGPFANFLQKLVTLKQRLSFAPGLGPLRVALVTSRSYPAELRVLNTLRDWGIAFDAAFFMGDLEKSLVLSVLNPHIFFDDQLRHIDKAKDRVPSALVNSSQSNERC